MVALLVWNETLPLMTFMGIIASQILCTTDLDIVHVLFGMMGQGGCSPSLPSSTPIKQRPPIVSSVGRHADKPTFTSVVTACCSHTCRPQVNIFKPAEKHLPPPKKKNHIFDIPNLCFVLFLQKPALVKTKVQEQERKDRQPRHLQAQSKQSLLLWLSEELCKWRKTVLDFQQRVLRIWPWDEFTGNVSCTSTVDIKWHVCRAKHFCSLSTRSEGVCTDEISSCSAPSLVQ